MYSPRRSSAISSKLLTLVDRFCIRGRSGRGVENAILCLSSSPVEALACLCNISVDGSHCVSPGPSTVLEGDPGEGGVFDAVVAGEWFVERDLEVLRGKGMSGFGATTFGADSLSATLNGFPCIGSTLCEFERRNRFLREFEAERFGGIVVFSDETGGGLYDEGDLCIFGAGGVAVVGIMRGFMGEVLEGEMAFGWSMGRSRGVKVGGCDSLVGVMASAGSLLVSSSSSSRMGWFGSTCRISGNVEECARWRWSIATDMAEVLAGWIFQLPLNCVVKMSDGQHRLSSRKEKSEKRCS